MKAFLLTLLLSFSLCAFADDASNTPPQPVAKVYHISFGIQIENDPSLYAPELAILAKATAQDTIYVHMANFGGSIWTGALLFNAIQNSKAHTITLVESLSFSMGAMLSCATNETIIEPYSWLMFHTYNGTSSGKGSEILTQALAVERLGKKMFNECVKKGILTSSQVLSILDGKDVYVFPEDVK